MKNARRKILKPYLTALRAHLSEKRGEGPDRAKTMGRAAVKAGLKTLDLAIVHEEAMFAIGEAQGHLPLSKKVFIQTGAFFTQAIIPLERIQHAAREKNSILLMRNRVLHAHAAELARGNRKLQREIVRRKAGETKIRKGEERYRTLLAESLLMQKRLRQLTRQIISAQEEERKEISRELHDEVVQTLVGINVELAALGKGASVGLHALKAKIARTQRLVENSVDAVHRFARELRPAVLDDLGLIPALHAYSTALAERKKLNIEMTAFGGVEALGNAKRTVLFRIAQEALTNVARHAHATRVRMTISEISGAVRMEINDNGKSFHVGKVLSAGNPKRLGLIGMRERVEMVGGILSIDSAPGRGTTVCAEIPFELEKTKR